MVIPSTHEEIDMQWDMVEAVAKDQGTKTAALFAKSLGLIDSEIKLEYFTTKQWRDYMHRVINGEDLTIGG